MTSALADMVASSKDAALVLSLAFNVVTCAAIWRLWKAHKAYQAKVTRTLIELVKELASLSVRLIEKKS